MGSTGEGSYAPGDRKSRLASVLDRLLPAASELPSPPSLLIDSDTWRQFRIESQYEQILDLFPELTLLDQAHRRIRAIKTAQSSLPRGSTIDYEANREPTVAESLREVAERVGRATVSTGTEEYVNGYNAACAAFRHRIELRAAERADEENFTADHPDQATPTLRALKELPTVQVHDDARRTEIWHARVAHSLDEWLTEISWSLKKEYLIEPDPALISNAATEVLDQLPELDELHATIDRLEQAERIYHRTRRTRANTGAGRLTALAEELRRLADAPGSSGGGTVGGPYATAYATASNRIADYLRRRATDFENTYPGQG